MPARSVVEALAGATLAISATLPETYDETGYEATDFVWTAVGDVENYGNHGITSVVITFIPVDTAVVAKAKGHKDYGNMALMIGAVPSDEGQAILKAASEVKDHYSIRITYADGIIHYLDVLVSKFEKQDGSVDDIEKISCELAVCRKPVEVAAP